MTPKASAYSKRCTNAIDFWRGFALVNILISHMPMNAFERLTLRHYSLSDAELFVFLAGWSLRVSLRGDAKPTTETARLMLRRAFRLYKTQIGVTFAALAIFALAAHMLADPSILRWGKVDFLLDQPVRGTIGLLTLTQQMQYFDIMPLYIVLSVLSPLVILANRRSPWLLLGGSATIWIIADLLRLNLPVWPAEGRWFFDPFAWQLCYVFGFVLAGDEAPRRLARAASAICFWPAVTIVVVGAVAAALHLSPDATLADFSLTSFLFSKTYLGPARALHFLALLIATCGIYPLIEQKLHIVARVGSLIGRNALPVFAAATLISLVGRIEKYIFGKAPLLDLCVVLTGILLLIVIARASEWRRLKSTQKRASSLFGAFAPQSPA